jgi:hypothetical protein
VPSWGGDYVGYLYHGGLTNGLGNGLFGSSQPINAQSYATFILRALGYNDKTGDFTFNGSLQKAMELGVINDSEYSLLRDNQTFLRDDLVGISYGSLPVNLKNSSKSLMAELIDAGAVDSAKAAQLGFSSSNNTKTTVTFIYSSDNYYKVQVDYDTLPESMKSMNGISVTTGSELPYAYAAFSENRVREGLDKPDPHTTQGTTTMSYWLGSKYTNIYLYKDKTLVGYGCYIGKISAGTVEFEFKPFNGLKFDAVRVNDSSLSFDKNHLLLIDRNKLPETVKQFSNISILNLILRSDTPVESVYDIASLFEFSKVFDLQQQFKYPDSGFDTSNYKELLYWDKCLLYFSDRNNECLGYYYMTPDEVLMANQRILNDKSNKSMTEYSGYHEAHINGAIWFGDKSLPEGYRDKSSYGDPNAAFVITIDEWLDDRDYVQLEEFMERADVSIKLVADGKPGIDALISGCFGSKEENIWGFVVSIQPDQLSKMQKSTEYKLAPQNRNEYKWIVKDGVTISKN